MGIEISKNKKTQKNTQIVAILLTYKNIIAKTIENTEFYLGDKNGDKLKQL